MKVDLLAPPRLDQTAPPPSCSTTRSTRHSHTKSQHHPSPPRRRATSSTSRPSPTPRLARHAQDQDQVRARPLGQEHHRAALTRTRPAPQPHQAAARRLRRDRGHPRGVQPQDARRCAPLPPPCSLPHERGAQGDPPQLAQRADPAPPLSPPLLARSRGRDARGQAQDREPVAYHAHHAHPQPVRQPLPSSRRDGPASLRPLAVSDFGALTHPHPLPRAQLHLRPVLQARRDIEGAVRLAPQAGVRRRQVGRLPPPRLAAPALCPRSGAHAAAAPRGTTLTLISSAA